MNTSGTSDIDDTARLDWLLENGYAIVPDCGAAGFASAIFRGRGDIDEAMTGIVMTDPRVLEMADEAAKIREQNPEAYAEIQSIVKKLWPM